MNLNYSINGVSFSSMRVFVAGSDGVLDGLTLKEGTTVDWPDAHGKVIDLSRPRFEAREISLDCWMVADSAQALITQRNTLLAELMKPGTQRLQLNPIAGKPLVYEVYYSGGLTFKKQWADEVLFASFQLKLIEPQPIKWVMSAQGGTTVSMRLTAPSPVVFFWGDGTNTEAIGSNVTISHTYPGSSSTTYYVILSGELERMGYHQITGLTEVWTRLF